MKITETMLVKGYVEISRGESKLSMVKGEEIYWEYRRNNLDGIGAHVCSPAVANFISLEYDRVGRIPLDDPRPDFSKIEEDAQEEWGTSIANS